MHYDAINIKVLQLLLRCSLVPPTLEALVLAADLEAIHPTLPDRLLLS